MHNSCPVWPMSFVLSPHPSQAIHQRLGYGHHRFIQKTNRLSWGFRAKRSLLGSLYGIVCRRGTRNIIIHSFSNGEAEMANWRVFLRRNNQLGTFIIKFVREYKSKCDIKVLINAWSKNYILIFFIVSYYTLKYRPFGNYYKLLPCLWDYRKRSTNIAIH